MLDLTSNQQNRTELNSEFWLVHGAVKRSVQTMQRVLGLLVTGGVLGAAPPWPPDVAGVRRVDLDWRSNGAGCGVCV